MALTLATQSEITALSDRDLRRGFANACRGFESAAGCLNFDGAEYALSYIDAVLDEWNRRHQR